MSIHAERVLQYLFHIRQAIERIHRFIKDIDEIAFLQNEIIQDAVIRNLEIIGEACRNIDLADPSFQGQHPGLPLSSAYRMRNALAHGYFKVDLSVVWNTVAFDLPPLLVEVRSIIERMASNGSTSV